MKTVLVEDKMHRKLKEVSDQNGMKLQALVAQLLEDGLYQLRRDRLAKVK